MHRVPGVFGKSIISEVAVDKAMGGNNLIFCQGPTLFKHDMSPRQPTAIGTLQLLLTNIISFAQVELSNGTWMFIILSDGGKLLWFSTKKDTMWPVTIAHTEVGGAIIDKSVFYAHTYLVHPKKLLLDSRNASSLILYIMQPTVPKIEQLTFKGLQVANTKEFLSTSMSITPFAMGFSASGSSMYFTFNYDLYSLLLNKSGQAPDLVKRLSHGSNNAILDLGTQNIIIIGDVDQSMSSYNLLSGEENDLCSNMRRGPVGVPGCGIIALSSVAMFNSTFMILAGVRGMRLIKSNSFEPIM